MKKLIPIFILGLLPIFADDPFGLGMDCEYISIECYINGNKVYEKENIISYHDMSLPIMNFTYNNNNYRSKIYNSYQSGLNVQCVKK